MRTDVGGLSAVIYYLNPQWDAQQLGGAIRLFPPHRSKLSHASECVPLQPPHRRHSTVPPHRRHSLQRVAAPSHSLNAPLIATIPRRPGAAVAHGQTENVVLETGGLQLHHTASVEEASAWVRSAVGEALGPSVLAQLLAAMEVEAVDGEVLRSMSEDEMAEVC
eukprot:SAG11_NODE_3082_length_2706_cov_18.779056_3_plen_164_part_00